MTGLREDVRYATRSIGRSPTLAIVIVLTLAVGIGLNTAIFSVVRGVLLKPLAFHDPSRLVMVTGRLAHPDNRPVLMSGGTFSRIAAAVPAFADVAAIASIRQNMRGDDLPIQVQVGWVSANFFSLLGVDAALGRRFADREPAGAVMLGHHAWRRLFNADANAIGRTLTLDGFSYTIVGVLPASFQFDLPTLPRDIDVWKVPDAWWQNGNVWASEGLSGGVLQFVARMTPTATETETARMVARFGERERGRQAALAAAGLELVVAPLQADMVREAKPILLGLFGAVVCVLLIACANVMNLLLVRAHARRRELAIRLALGSSRGRLIRLMAIESVVLAGAAGLGGCAAAVYGVRLLVALSPARLPRVGDIGVDAAAFAFAAAIVLLCPFIFGLLPALHATRSASVADIRGHGGTASADVRIGQTIAAGQLALSIVLLVAAGLLGTSLLRLNLVRLGFQPSNLLTFSVSLPGTRYHRPDETGRFVQQLEDRIAAFPEVRAVGTIWPMPLSGRRWAGNYVIGVSPDGPHGLADYRLASAGLFDALGNRLLDGRTFRDADESRDVVIVSRSLARIAWPAENPIGRVVQANPWGGAAAAFEVIGVADDIRAREIRTAAVPALYFDSRRWSWTDWEMNIVVRTAGDPRAAVPHIRSELGRLDATVPMAQVRSMDDYVSDNLAANRFTLLLVSAFAAVAVGLAVMGLYGVVSYAVGQRTREFGVRMALGADRRSIVRLVVGGGVKLASAGIAAGLLGALWVTELFERMLFGTSPQDPATFVGVAGFLGLVAIVACYVPARRAARVDPAETLRGL